MAIKPGELEKLKQQAVADAAEKLEDLIDQAMNALGEFPASGRFLFPIDDEFLPLSDAVLEALAARFGGPEGWTVRRDEVTSYEPGGGLTRPALLFIDDRRHRACAAPDHGLPLEKQRRP